MRAASSAHVPMQFTFARGNASRLPSNEDARVHVIRQRAPRASHSNPLAITPRGVALPRGDHVLPTPSACSRPTPHRPSSTPHRSLGPTLGVSRSPSKPARTPVPPASDPPRRVLRSGATPPAGTPAAFLDGARAASQPCRCCSRRWSTPLRSRPDRETGGPTPRPHEHRHRGAGGPHPARANTDIAEPGPYPVRANAGSAAPLSAPGSRGRAERLRGGGQAICGRVPPSCMGARLATVR